MTDVADTGCRAPLRVLLVEDEPFLALDLEQCFNARGAIVHIVDNVAGALECDLSTIDFAVLDIDIDSERMWPVADWLLTEAKPYMLATGLCSTPEKIRPAHRHVPCLTKPVETCRVVELAFSVAHKMPARK